MRIVWLEGGNYIMSVIYLPLQPTLESNFTKEEQEVITKNWHYYIDVRFGTLSPRKFITLCKEVLAYEREEV